MKQTPSPKRANPDSTNSVSPLRSPATSSNDASQCNKDACPNGAALKESSESTADNSIPGSRVALFFVLLLLGLALDLGTKSWIFALQGFPGEKPTLWLIPNVVGFQTSLNEGALFGMGQGQIPLFTVVSLITFAFIQIWLFLFNGARSLWITVACGFISAGILGNLYDRLGYHGLLWNAASPANALHEMGTPVFAVRDWILVMIGSWPWPNFNIADSLLVTGVAIIAVVALFSDCCANNK